MVDSQSYKETGILVVDLQSYKETGILWWMCRVIKKREYCGGLRSL